jgi:signal transduction histidine kinase
LKIGGWRLPERVPFRLRFFFRGVFLLLALATVGLALAVLQDEKQRSHRVYAEGLTKSQGQIAARLRHPTGQLMLLNPGLADRPVTPVAPLVLPFSALDFDDRTKAQQAVETAGCALQYADGSTLCAAVGSNPYAGGFLYLVGSFASGELVTHLPGDLELTDVHRAVVEVSMRGQTWRWIAPYESGRLTGYAGDAPIAAGARPVRDFRGWLWQEGRRSLFSIRLPVELWRDALTARPVQWPPPELERVIVRVKLLAPGDGAPLFDSDAAGAARPFSIADLKPLLLPGETLAVTREGDKAPLLRLTGSAEPEPTSKWIDAVIRRLPVEGYDTPLVARETIVTPLGRYAIVLTGDLRSVNRQLAAVATRLAWFIAAMLAAVLLAWLAIELTVIRRVTLLTKRAAAVSTGMRAGSVPALDVADLRGGDELGVLAQGLRDLLARVNEDVRREQIRAEQEKNQWHAVGHEIMSPLQSLMALHGAPDDPSARYITRMQQAVRVLYGQASPSEAFESTTLELQTIDADAFLGHVAGNAGYIGIDGVVYEGRGAPLPVRAEEYALEDVVTHVLRNAARHRTPGTPIRITLDADAAAARITLHNDGPPIASEPVERIFEYGVSSAPEGEGHRGQGLFVARTYMAKMNGTIAARNGTGGVDFVLTLPRAA